MAQYQEDEWKQMVNRDLCSGSVAGNSGHGTMPATGEESSGGVYKSVTTEHL